MNRRSLYDVQAMMDTAQVLAWRLPLLAFAMVDPNAARRREAVRMVTEKQEALALGLIGAQAALWRAWLEGSTDLSRVTSEAMRAAEAPAVRRLGRNARRLSGRRP